MNDGARIVWLRSCAKRLSSLEAAIGVLLAVVTLGFASTEKAVDRPPGIAIDQWFPISDHLGLVVSDYQPELDPLIDNGPVEVPPVPRTPSAPIITQQTAELLRLLDGPRNPVDATHPGSITPALAGYLMIKQRDHWTRLSLVSPAVLPRGTEGVSP